VSCYVALGDSISIDDYAGGSGCGGASLLARNRDDDFPAWHGHDLADLPFHLLATDGATSQTLLDHQLPRLERGNVRPSVVTVTIGGNDVLGWYGDTAGAVRAADAAVARTDEALDRLRRLVVPDARIVVGTVYDPSDGTADAASVGLPPWPKVCRRPRPRQRGPAAARRAAWCGRRGDPREVPRPRARHRQPRTA
jgi:lysophospholipase L1-like esterase